MDYLRKELFHYLISQTDILSEKWMRHLEKENVLYAANGARKNSERLKQQNGRLLLLISNVFAEGKSHDKKILFNWASSMAEERASRQEPLPDIIQQFKYLRTVYLDEVKMFIEKTQAGQLPGVIFDLVTEVNAAFDDVIIIFIEQFNLYIKSRMEAQREVIKELGAPIILLTKTIAVLPLIGDIDTHRAKNIQESSLKQCIQYGVEKLFIDLSGVHIIDTMVANQLFEIIASLKLIGVKVILSGLRPEIAYTAVQLGIDFSNVLIEGKLMNAFKKMGVLSEQGYERVNLLSKK